MDQSSIEGSAEVYYSDAKNQFFTLNTDKKLNN